MEVKRVNKVEVAVLAMAMLMIFSCIAPALAKNLNYPPGVEIIHYINAGGQADIPILTPLPPNYPTSTTDMRLSFKHVEMPNAGLSFSGLLVQLRILTTGATNHSWQPFAYITTNADEEQFVKNVWSGSFINFDATSIGLPASFSTYNIKVVSEDVLQVDRHGNSVTLNLNSPQQIKRPSGPSVYFTLPALSLDLNKIDNAGSTQLSMTVEFKGYKNSSNYTFVSESMGFAANGVFTCSGLPLNTGPVTNTALIMKGTQTYYPPS
jgi:hypothetical protein